MTRSDIATLNELLTSRDNDILDSLDKFRLMTSRQIQRLHFDPHHPTAVAAARACNRAVARLRYLGVIKALARRIGGARSGSAGFVWYLGAAGERVLSHRDPTAHAPRRNYREPSRHFVDHTLAVAELAVQTVEASRAGRFEVIAIETEPANWRQSLSPQGTAVWLKPDLHLITANDDFEHHWFIEVDLATEHLPVIIRQCTAYQAYRATGRYQATYGLFPAVLWVTPAQSRSGSIKAATGPQNGLDGELFQVATNETFLAAVEGQKTG